MAPGTVPSSYTCLTLGAQLHNQADLGFGTWPPLAGPWVNSLTSLGLGFPPSKTRTTGPCLCGFVRIHRGTFNNCDLPSHFFPGVFLFSYGKTNKQQQQKNPHSITWLHLAALFSGHSIRLSSPILVPVRPSTWLLYSSLQTR